jgi:hypothetical protein
MPLRGVAAHSPSHPCERTWHLQEQISLMLMPMMLMMQMKMMKSTLEEKDWKGR